MGSPGIQGEKGNDGNGFHVTPDLQNKKVINIDTPDDHKVDDDYNTIVNDLKSAVKKNISLKNS